MSKYLKFLVLAMLMVGLLAGSAFAGTLGNIYGVPPTNTPTTVATELFPAAGYSRADHLRVFYNSTASFAQNDVITFTFSNVKLTETAFNLCNATTDSATPVATYIGSAPDATNGVSTLVFRISLLAGVNNTQTLYIANACEAAGEYTTATNILDVKFPQLTAGANATVSAEATFGTGISIPGATAAAVNLYTVQDQYSIAAPALKTSTVDFDQDMKKLVVAAPDTATLATASSITLASLATALPAALVATDQAVLTLAGSMSGIARICYNDVACLATSTTKFTIDTTANTATYTRVLSTPVIGDLNHALTFVVDGTTPLSERTFKLTVLLDLTGADKLDRTLLSAQDYFKLALNAYQAIVPYVKTATGVDTYIRLNSSYVSTGTEANKVKATVLCGGGTQSVVNIGQITPGTSLLVTGTNIKTAAGATCISDTIASNGFPVMLTVNAPSSNVTALGVIIQPEGLRPLPMKANTSGYSE